MRDPKWCFEWRSEYTISGHTKQINHITQLIGVEPYLSFNEGEETSSGSTAKCSWWRLRIDGLPEASLALLLDKIEPKKSELLAFIANEGLDHYFTLVEFTSAGDSGAELPPPLLRRVSDFGASLFIQVYTCDEITAGQQVAEPDRKHVAQGGGIGEVD